MIILLAVLVVLLLGAAAAWMIGRRDVPGVPDPAANHHAVELPEGPVGPEELVDLRFDLAPRGYRMEQVDAALDRLGRELAERDAEIARLRQEAERRTTAEDDGTGGFTR